ncbi:NFX1-type zinc finger-containing protein 1-like [Halichondria panicea]|uniref:NFX1-type zinc finger-containing protein 1-like n=1 Tax=Halichondria panicea TaxID=6063 RepID=UPI00312BA448
MDRKRGRGRSRGRGGGREGAQSKQYGAQGEGTTDGNTYYFGARGGGGGRDRGRGGRGGRSGGRGRPRDSTMRMERPPSNYFTCGDIEELSQADNQTVIRRITQNENGFLNAFKHDKFLKSPTVLKQLLNIVYKLSQSSDTQTALRVLAQLFSSSGEYSLFMFQLQLLISEIKPFMREGNLQSLFYLTEVGKFCFEKIPKTVQNTFPIKEIKATVKSLTKYNISSENEQVTLEGIEQNLLELQIQHLTFEEEQVRPKPKPIRQIGDVDLEPPEDFSTLPILPVPNEINQFATRPYLRPNIIKGEYHSWEHYLDIQFRLLREDFVGPLREGIADYLHNPTQKGGDVRVYRNVTIQQPVCLAMGIGFEISFNMRALRRINWEYTKRLITGSLLCLSTDEFQTIAFASVAQRETKQLEKGIVTVKFEGSVNGFQLHSQTEYTMVESVAYLEAYRHVLEKLQEVCKEHEIDMMPFRNYIVNCSFDNIPLPRYLNHFGHTIFDLQGIIEIKSKLASSIVDLTKASSWPDASVTDLDPSQMRALQAALTQEISVIQGPPGTGKTYVGMKIVKAFLANKKVWDPQKTTPILVVCYTNHALDQFLEGIRNNEIDGKPPNVTRIGGRCKSEILQECTLFEKVKKAKADQVIPGREFRDYKEATHCMLEKKDLIIQHLKTIHLSNLKILRTEHLRFFISSSHRNQLISNVYTKNPMELWLGLGYEDPSDEVQTTEELQVAEAFQPELLEDTEAQMIQDDRLVEGNEVVYKASEEEEWQLEKVTKKKKNDGDWHTVQMAKNKKRMLIYKQLNHGLQPMAADEAASIIDLWSLDGMQRWRLYLYWRDMYVTDLRQQLEHQSGKYKTACEEFQLKKQDVDMTIVRDSDVVGMTTTGAAKHKYIIKSIRPKIVVIEEAAEIFEPHIFSSLSPTVQQLVLIGDHQQLRPKPTYYVLEKKYDFNVSLFERLAMNDCPVQTLSIQHRMRPEIASLITPAIYKELDNHESVYNYGHIQGIGKNLFFITHTQPELAGADDRQSHSNPHEAKYLGALCDYLLKQGYKPEEITILTLYRGQLLEIKNVLRLRMIIGVRTAVVDDFQGEENRIILLSLVRSNNEQRIGFVGIENRICVALSRAKMSLFIIGNVQMLRDKVETVWPKIIDKLKEMNCIGEALPLHCHIHQDQKVKARMYKDFLKCPEGGCQKKCNARLPCGHVCPRFCHPYDIEHREYECLLNCRKQLPCGHICKQKCYECSVSCQPCKEQVTKVLPVCGHSEKCTCSDNLLLIKCSKICGKPLTCGHLCQEKCSQPCTPQCTVKLDKELSCGHTVQDSCYLKEELVECSVPCGALLDCEHPCTGTCYTCKMGRLHIGCKSKCNRTLICGHLCDFPCTPSCPPCSKPCANFCTHRRCPRKCFEPCAPCMERCDWSCPHFICTQPCGMPCNRPPCNQPCRKYMLCGHRCIGICGEVCPKLCRICDEEVVTEIFFGTESEKDARFVLLPDCNHIIVVEMLDQWMSTDNSVHTGESQQIALKVCPRCKTPVRKCFRYGNDIRSKLADVEAIKKKQMSTIDSIRLPLELAKLKHAFKNIHRQNRHVIAEELSSIEVMVAGRRRLSSISTLFPHIVKAKVLFLHQIVKTHNVLNQIGGSDYFATSSYQPRIDKIKRDLNELKQFFMQEFLSQQQLSDAEAEMRRIFLLAKATELQAIIAKEDDECITQTVIELEESGWKCEKVTEEKEASFIERIKSLRGKYRLISVYGVSETAQFILVKVIGLSKGHWYKCPNSHYYAIGECGVMETGKCPECNAGVSHTFIAAGNVHALEMDGSKHTA